MTPTAAVAGVLLDVDDTLVDTRGAFEHAIQVGSIPELRPGLGAKEVTDFWRADRHGHYRAHARGEMTHVEQRKLRALDMYAEFDGPVMSDADYVAWEQRFEQAFQDGWRAHDDASPLLDALDAADVPYGALTNARAEYQEGKLAACGLERVPVLVGVDTLGFGKPDPRVFTEAASRLGTDPARTAYVGDEADIDARAAAAAGLVGVWCDRGLWPPPQDGDDRIVAVTSLADLPAAVGIQ